MGGVVVVVIMVNPCLLVSYWILPTVLPPMINQGLRVWEDGARDYSVPTAHNLHTGRL